MAIPVIEGWTVNDTGGATASSITLSKPSGVQVNDLLLIMVGADNSNVAGWSTLSGWTQFINFNNSTADADIACYWRIADGTEDATVAVGHPTSCELFGWYIRISGANTITPIHLVGTPQGTSGTSHIVFAINTTIDDCLAFFILAFDGGDTTYFNVTGSGWVKGDDQWSGTSGTDASGCWGSKGVPLAGSTADAGVFVSTTDGSSRVQFAVAPGGEAPPTGWTPLEYDTEPPISGQFNKLLYVSEPPIPSAWNKLKYKP